MQRDQSKALDIQCSLDRILLWAIRAWMMRIVSGIPIEERIQNVFAKLGASAAADQLYELVWLIGHRATRTIDLDCVCQTTVSADEHALLDIIALAQEGRSFETMMLLRGMLGPMDALAAAEGAARVAATLTQAGRFLLPRQFGTTRYVLAPVSSGFPGMTSDASQLH